MCVSNAILTSLFLVSCDDEFRDSWQRWILCNITRLTYLSTEIQAVPTEFHCLDFEMSDLKILPNVFVCFDVTNKCCPLAGWRWWSCTATRTTTTRSILLWKPGGCAGPLCLRPSRLSETIFIHGPKQTAWRLVVTSSEWWLPRWLVIQLFHPKSSLTRGLPDCIALMELLGGEKAFYWRLCVT